MIGCNNFLHIWLLAGGAHNANVMHIVSLGTIDTMTNFPYDSS